MGLTTNFMIIFGSLLMLVAVIKTFKASTKGTRLLDTVAIGCMVAVIILALSCLN